MIRSLLFFSIILCSQILLFSQAGCTDKPSKSVHFNYYYNEILFNVSINNSAPLCFILDTGASDLIVNEKTALALNLPLGKIVDQGFAGIGEERVYETRIEEIDLKINDSSIKFTEGVYAGNLSLIETVMGHHIDGVIGRHIFEKYVVEIDYRNKIFNLYDPDNYSYQGNGSEVKLRIHGVPYAMAKVVLPNNESIETGFMIDNGSAGELSFTSTFCSKYNLPGQMQSSIPSIQTGGGGNSDNRIGRINTVTIGGYKINNPTAAVSNDTNGGMSRNDIGGLIGNGILQHFKVIFDYHRSRMILDPYESVLKPMDWDMSGLFIYAVGNKFDQINIYDVIPGSPADEAGIKAGDKIISVDNSAEGSYSIDEISKIFKSEGRQYRLKIKRDDKYFNTVIKLRRLI